MAASMRYEREYAADIVSCPDVGACAGWIGWPLFAPTPQPPEGPIQTVVMVAGEPLSHSIEDSAREVEGYAAGAGAAPVGRCLQQLGINGLRNVRGIFSGFFMDRTRGESILFTDRYGVERLFLHQHGTRLFFASEAKAILAAAPSARAIDSTGLAEWVSCGCTLGSRSLFSDVELLESGTALILSPAREPRRTRYFDRATLEQLPALRSEDFLESFENALHAAVNEALTRGPAAAISLTGGLDSRLVLGCADAAPHTQPCYTFGSMYRTTGDVAVARAIAAACNQPHRELKLDHGFLENVQEHLRQAVYISDGYLGFSGSTELYLNRQARAIAPVRVTGNWGGELMRGVRAFKFRMPKGDFLRPSFRAAVDEAQRTFSAAAPAHPLSFTLFQQAPNQGYGRYAVERSQMLMRSPFLSEEVVRSLYQAPPTTRTSTDMVVTLLSSRPQLIAIPTDVGRLGRGPRPVRALRHAYRRAIVKGEYLTSHGAPDWMAALTARLPMLETAFLGRDKFQHFRLWTRQQLSSQVRDVLVRDSRARASLDPWFDTARIAAMVEAHVAGRANYTEEIDRLITIAVSHQTLISAAPPGEATDVPHRVISAATATPA